MGLNYGPQQHDKFRCEKCGMELEITKSCPCKDKGPEFRCCGTEMIASKAKVGESLTPEAEQNAYTA